jgi:hypothetical protein
MKHLMKNPIEDGTVEFNIQDVVHLVTDVWVPVDESGRLRLLDEFLATHKAVEVYQHLYRFEEIPEEYGTYHLRYTVPVKSGRMTLPFPVDATLVWANFISNKVVTSAVGVPIRLCRFGGLDIIVPSGVHQIELFVNLSNNTSWRIPTNIIERFNALLPRLGKYELQVESSFAKVLAQSPLTQTEKLAIWVNRQVFQRRIYMETSALVNRLFLHCGHSLLTAISALRIAPPELLAMYSTARLNTLGLPSVLVSGITVEAKNIKGKFDMNPHSRTITLVSDSSNGDIQAHEVDLSAKSYSTEMEELPWAIKRSLVTEFGNKRGEKLLRFANEVHGWIIRGRYPYKVTLPQKIKAALVLPTLKGPLRRKFISQEVGITRKIDQEVKSLTNAVFVQAYLLELERAFELAFRTEDSGPVYALLLEELPVADPASLARIRGDADVETNVRAQIFEFAEVCLSPYSIPLAQQSIKWLLQDRTQGEGWFTHTVDGDDEFLKEYIEGGWSIPIEGFNALTPKKIERFIRRIERVKIQSEKGLLNQLRIWFAAVTSYYLNNGLAEKMPHRVDQNWYGSYNSGWQDSYPNAQKLTWGSLRGLAELTPTRRGMLQDFFRKIAQRFPTNQSTASVSELQSIFVKLARLKSGGLDAALLREARADNTSEFLDGLVDHYPLDQEESRMIAVGVLKMVGDRYDTTDLTPALQKLTLMGLDIRKIVDKNSVTKTLIAAMAHPIYARTTTSEYRLNYPCAANPGSYFLSTTNVSSPIVLVYRKAMALKVYDLVDEPALMKAFPKVDEQTVIADVLSKLTINRNNTLLYNLGLFSGNEVVADLDYYPTAVDKMSCLYSVRAFLWLSAPRFRQSIPNWDIKELFFRNPLVQSRLEALFKDQEEGVPRSLKRAFDRDYTKSQWYDFRLWLAVLRLRGVRYEEQGTSKIFKQLTTELNDSSLESVVTQFGVIIPSAVGISLALRTALIMLAAVSTQNSACYKTWPFSQASIFSCAINPQATLADLWREGMQRVYQFDELPTWFSIAEFAIPSTSHEQQQRKSYPSLAVTPGRAGAYLEDRTFNPEVDDESDICWETSRGTGEILVPVYATTEARDIHLVVDVSLLHPTEYGPYLPDACPRVNMISKVVEFCMINRLRLDITVWGRSEVLYCEKVCTPDSPNWFDEEAIRAIAACSDELVRQHEKTLDLTENCKYDRLFRDELPRYSKRSVLTMLFAPDHEDEARNLATNLAQSGYLTAVI